MNTLEKPKEHLVLDDILSLLGEEYTTNQDKRNARKRLARRLRNMEEQTNSQLLFGKEGSRLWSTRAALRHVWPHLIPPEKSVNERVAEVAEDIVSSFEDRICMLEAKVDVLAGIIRKDRQAA